VAVTVGISKFTRPLSSTTEGILLYTCESGNCMQRSIVGWPSITPERGIAQSKQYFTGWTARVDRFNTGGQANFEIHIYIVLVKRQESLWVPMVG
jgi:hypothetical protein